MAYSLYQARSTLLEVSSGTNFWELSQKLWVYLEKIIWK